MRSNSTQVLHSQAVAFAGSAMAMIDRLITESPNDSSLHLAKSHIENAVRQLDESFISQQSSLARG